MLVIGCPDRHALPHITSSKMRRPRCVLPPARAGSFYHPERTSGAGIKRQILSTSGANHTLGTRIGRRLSVESECGAVAVGRTYLLPPPTFCCAERPFALQQVRVSKGFRARFVQNRTLMGVRRATQTA
jgi:hypothetical protein